MKLFQRTAQFACLVGLSCAAQAQQTCNASIPESTPTADFVDNRDGTVTHSRTGLMWKRCAEGQAWSGSTCTGIASSAPWAGALKVAVSTATAGYKDWRLPNMKELESIVEDRCASPAINVNVFPNTASSVFWSASAYAASSSYAWVVYFSNGYADDGSKGNAYQVRLVRAGPSFASFDALDTWALTVAKTGTGTVSGGTINCGILCSGKAGKGFDLTLTATPAANLLTWGGACSGSAATCIVTMDAAKSVTASFKDTALASGLPSALSFATQNIGTTSTAQSVTLSNAGTAAMAISGIAATGDFGVTHNCGTGLGAGGFCTLGVTFKPTATGPRTGNITVASNAPGSPHSIALSGTGQGGAGVVNTSSLSFASQGAGTTSAKQTVTLSNTGVAALNIASIEVTGDFARTTTCGTTLETRANCNISVSFSPTALGARSGTLVITSDSLNSPISIALSGTGVASPAVTLSKTALSFVSTGAAGTNLVQTVTLTNSGTAPLNLTSIAASGDFSVDNNCGAGLGAGGSCTLTVTFRPAGTANATGSILITSNAPGSPHAVTLSASDSTPSADADKVFSWAERTYPEFFSPANGASQTITGYRLRAYSGGGFLAVNDSVTPNLYYLGPLSGNKLLDLGALSTWLTQVGP
jgi:hypothetical protein